MVAVGFGLHGLLAAPFPNFANQLLAGFSESYSLAYRLLVEQVYSAVEDFFNLDHSPLWLLVRLQVLFMLGWAGYLLARRSDDEADRHEAVLILAGLGMLLGAAVFLYDIHSWRDFRLFAPVLLMLTLVFIA